MDIKLSNGTIINTDKMSDREADLTEAIQSLYKLCEKYGVTAFARVIVNKDGKYLGFSSVNDANVQGDYMLLMGTINEFVEESSDGCLGIMEK